MSWAACACERPLMGFLSAERAVSETGSPRHPPRTASRAGTHRLLLLRHRRTLSRTRHVERDGFLRRSEGRAGRQGCGVAKRRGGGCQLAPTRIQDVALRFICSRPFPLVLLSRLHSPLLVACSLPRSTPAPALALSDMAVHYTSLAGEPGQHSALRLSLAAVANVLLTGLDPADIGNDAPRPTETKGIHLHHLCLRIKVRLRARSNSFSSFADILYLTGPENHACFLPRSARHADALHLQRWLVLDVRPRPPSPIATVAHPFVASATTCTTATNRTTRRRRCGLTFRIRRDLSSSSTFVRPFHHLSARSQG